MENIEELREYLFYRNQILEYTNEDMNLSLENDEQVYIALFDIPMKSNIIGFNTQTLALVFGLNTHIYHGSGKVIVDLEKYENVMKAMQSLLISSHQVLPEMKLINDFEYYDSENVRVSLKTRKGIFFREIKKSGDKIDKFLLMLMDYIIAEIIKTGKLENR